MFGKRTVSAKNGEPFDFLISILNENNNFLFLLFQIQKRDRIPLSLLISILVRFYKFINAPGLIASTTSDSEYAPKAPYSRFWAAEYLGGDIPHPLLCKDGFDYTSDHAFILHNNRIYIDRNPIYKKSTIINHHR